MTRRAILDLKGLSRHSYHSGNPRSTIRNADNALIPSAAHAVYQFIEHYLKPIIFEHGIAPIDIVVVKEGKENNSRRRAIFPEYKTKVRPEDADTVQTDERNKAMDLIERLMLGLGCIVMETPFCEADDTIAYVVERTEGEKLIFTVDYDLLQLHREGVQIYVPTREVEGQLTIKTDFKGMSFVGDPDDLSVTVVDPFMVVLWKAIVGDTSDGFKGVPGMGEGKIGPLIEKYGLDGMQELCSWAQSGDFSELEAALQAEPCKLLQKLLDNKDEFRKCYWLAKLHPEWCEQEFRGVLVKPKYTKRVPTRRIVDEVLEQCGIGFIAKDLDPVLPYQWLEDANSWPTSYEQWLEAMQASPIVAFDYETWDTVKHQPFQEARKGGYVDMLNSEITGASFCFGHNLQHSFYLPVNHRDTANVKLEEVHAILMHLRENRIQAVAHNVPFECTVSMQNFDFSFNPEQLPHDTLIMASHVNENEEGGLKKLSKSHLNYDQINYSQVVPSGGDMRDVSGEEVLAYGADDSVVSAHLWVKFSFILECERTAQFAKEIEPFFAQALLIPFIKGVPINYGRLAELKEEDDNLFMESEAEVRKLLTEHCSEVNEEGFKIIWPEISDFLFATLKSKSRNQDEIRETLTLKKAEIYERCQYIPYAAPVIERNKASVSKAAQSIGLPPIRSLKAQKLRDYYDNLMIQVEARGVEPSGAQLEFLQLIVGCADGLETYVKTTEVFKVEPEGFPGAEALFQYIEIFYSLDQDLWQGDELNVGSSLQMGLLFYGKMGLPILIRNEMKNEEGVRSRFDLEGAPSTNEIAIKTWLAEMQEDDWRYQVLELILKLRAVRTRRQLYYVPYPKWKSPIDGMIHPGLRNCGTITRRPSGSSPNILQVSKIKDDGKMRATFMPHRRAIIWEKAA